MKSDIYMKKLLLACLLTITALLPMRGQGWESVKGSPEYVWGEGKATTVEEADKKALADLISKITVSVSSNIQLDRKTTDTSAQKEFAASVKTYANATLNNTRKEILANEPDAHVARWIAVSEIDRIFEGRKLKIRSYLESAQKALSKGKIDVALKDYYWGLALVKTLRYPAEMTYETADGAEVRPLGWVPEQINEVLSGLKANVESRDGDNLVLRFTYAGKPVSSVDYAYFDGRDWSPICSARDGRGVAELAPGFSSATLQIRYELAFRSEAHVDGEVQSVLETITVPAFRNAYANLELKPAKVKTPKEQNALASTFSDVSEAIFRMPAQAADTKQLEEKCNAFVRAVQKKDYALSDPLFTDEGRKIFDALVKYGKGTVVGKPAFTFYNTDSSVVAKGLQMTFSFPTGMRRSFTEDVSLYFNPEGKIENIAFGLGKTAETDILGKGIWDEKARVAILSFLENYQTAYALKRIDYIESIFDDDAVIITGTVARTSGHLGGERKSMQYDNEIIRYNRHTKDSYIKQLRRSFAGKEFINIRFADNEVRKLSKGGEMYAIQISQEYYSSNYGDKGYLFLMVDINNPEAPLIKVRTWQPDKDPDFGVYGPEHFF